MKGFAALAAIGLVMQQSPSVRATQAQTGAIRVIVRLAETSIPLPDVEVTVSAVAGAGGFRA